ncbi:hypothetical protein K461DRAFT_7077 [Myriangium duriaei CBS 260.36]|uniref:Uncharacterized protein n=1 Tax=Myriangium duriaei CBS 260.36 TaxID=1168546 RepID=A0A9P4J7Q8_9PEZI|nr:hypothetical protein K461DRAFT_7077 [Myriangium duriaei CBS 260.36]
MRSASGNPDQQVPASDAIEIVEELSFIIQALPGRGYLASQPRCLLLAILYNGLRIRCIDSVIAYRNCPVAVQHLEKMRHPGWCRQFVSPGPACSAHTETSAAACGLVDRDGIGVVACRRNPNCGSVLACGRSSLGCGSTDIANVS